jgi:hypothetical protein
MANTIQHKRSATASSVPSTGSLSAGELAVNTADGKVFLKKDNNTIVQVGNQPAGSSGQVQTNSSGSFYADNGLTYDKSTAGFEQLKVGSHGVKFLTISGRVATGSGGSVIQPNTALDIESVTGSPITIGDASGNYDGTTIVVDSTDISLNASTVTISCPVVVTGTTSCGGYILSSSGIQAKTASYTLVAADNGKVITMSVATANTLTVPASLAVGFNCTVIQIGAGQTTITTSAGVTLNSYQSALKISGQHGSASIISYVSNVYNVSGSLVT